jgi:sterol desaturase/sphingolipid hydroxylase (fatty acid hydroxylase superfamily)
MINHIFGLIGSTILAILFIILFLLESKFQLRKTVAGRRKRAITNFIVSIPAFTLLRILFIPAMVWLAYQNETLHFGVNYFFNLPPLLEGLIAFLVLDYGNFLWHILNHKIPLLWRFHLVHHTDVDMDITTAFRFHFGELIGSVLFRGAFTFLSGASPMVILIYEIVFEAITQFHHSNLKLPFYFERLLNKIIVTPRMHGIHHSVIKNETDSNFSVIFSFWDRLHHTFIFRKSQENLVIGVPSYNNEKELTIGFLLKLPFTSIRSWDKIPVDKNEISNDKVCKGSGRMNRV